MYPLSVATINILNRGDRWLQRRHLLVSELVDTEPDLVSLQEISLSIGQGTWLVRQVNARLSGDSRRPYHLVQQRRSQPSHWIEAIGIMSKVPILYHDSISLGVGGRVALRVNIDLSTEKTHTSHASLDFVAVHLHPPAEADEVRLAQSMQMVGWLNERRRVPLQIIAGDFNEIPTGKAIQFMKQTYRSAYAEVKGSEPLATFPTCLVQPLLDWSGCLDYVFVSPAVYRVSKARLFCDGALPEDDTLYPSDHVGLLVDLEV